MGQLDTPEVKPRYRQSLAAFCEALLAEETALAPYANNYRGGHIRALETTYPVTEALLGETDFGSLGQVYLDHYPPRHWDLNLFGGQLPELIAAQVHGRRGSDAPWAPIANIARIEYAMTRSYYAPDRHGDATSALLIPGLNSPDDGIVQIASQLAVAHPYARVTPALSLKQTLHIWREHGQVRVEHLPSPPAADRT